MFRYHASRKAYGNRRFNDDMRRRIDGFNFFNHGLYGTRVEVIRLRVVIGGRADDDEIRISERIAFVSGGTQLEWLCFEIVLNIGIFDRRDLTIQIIDLASADVVGNHLVMLSQQNGH